MNLSGGRRTSIDAVGVGSADFPGKLVALGVGSLAFYCGPAYWVLLFGPQRTPVVNGVGSLRRMNPMSGDGMSESPRQQRHCP